MRDRNYAMKFGLLLTIGVAISFFCLTSPQAQGENSGFLSQIATNTAATGNYLKQIAMNTGIQLQANQNAVGGALDYWINLNTNLFEADSTTNFPATPTPVLQGWMASYGAQLRANNKFLKSKENLSPIITTLFGSSPSDFKNKTGIDPNQLSYPTLLGVDAVGAKSASDALQDVIAYINNASGLSITHQTPGANWQGNKSDQQTYSNYYNTVMAIQSYNGYLMSNMLADYQSDNNLTKLQDELLKQASNSTTMMVQISTEPMALVLRQLLLFVSQIYVIHTQMLTVQKQMLYAQGMTNTLGILNSTSLESVYSSKAQGTRPK